MASLVLIRGFYSSYRFRAAVQSVGSVLAGITALYVISMLMRISSSFTVRNADYAGNLGYLGRIIHHLAIASNCRVVVHNKVTNVIEMILFPSAELEEETISSTATLVVTA